MGTRDWEQGMGFGDGKAGLGSGDAGLGTRDWAGVWGPGIRDLGGGGAGLGSGDKSLGTWGTRDWALGTRDWRSRTGDMRTGIGDLKLGTGNLESGTRNQALGIRDKGPGTGDPQSGGWSRPTPGGLLQSRGGGCGGVSVPVTAPKLPPVTPVPVRLAAATRVLSSRRSQPVAPGGSCPAPNFPGASGADLWEVFHYFKRGSVRRSPWF